MLTSQASVKYILIVYVVQRTGAPNRPKPVLIITERTMDMFAPFLHEFTYQAMCNDLLNIEGGVRYRYGLKLLYL